MSAAELAKYDLVYLATPYSKYPFGIEVAFEHACDLTSRLLMRGVNAYSPIVYAHTLAITTGLDPLDHDMWLRFDEPFMMACDALVIAEMDGWSESFGISHERDLFKNAGMPVFNLNPESMAITARWEPPPQRYDWVQVNGDGSTEVINGLALREDQLAGAGVELLYS